MKKCLCLLAAVLLLAVSAAAAEIPNPAANLESMTNEELLSLLDGVFAELESRGLAWSAASEAKTIEDYRVMSRAEDFLKAWAADDLDGMLELCDAAWQAQEENARTALFALLANRTPTVLEAMIPFDETSGVRTVDATVLMDRHNGMDQVHYRLQLVMKQAADGLWYLDPSCLKTYQVVEGYTAEEATPEPESDIRPQDTVLYYVPEGGEKYHADRNCPTVHEKYLPMQGQFLCSELNDEAYAGLKPCNVCGAPLREPAE